MAELRPKFNDNLFEDINTNMNPAIIINHIDELIQKNEPIPHTQILSRLIDLINPLDYREIAELTEDEKLKNKHYHIITAEKVLDLAEQNKWGICRNNNFIYLYNGAYWSLLNADELKTFLGKAAEKMGIDQFDAKHFPFRDALYKQFLELATLPKPNQPKDVVLINQKNGTFEISPAGTRLRPFDPADFITYQLPFAYNPEAQAPLFTTFLNKVLPDPERQRILAEYLGYVFIKNGTIKEEKVLFLYGTGANGKSVFHEVVKALLGTENTSQYSLQDLTDEKGYCRAMISNKLVNYASEIDGKLQAAIFKQLASGETVSARLPYGNPMEISDYARFIFNVNELPREVEQTQGFFRRFLIVPFDVTIPEAEQDKQLHTKIIESELSGVFNWVLAGLNRLLEQKQFSDCQASNQALEQYKLLSNNVKLFMEENNYRNSPTYKLIKDLYQEYQYFCTEGGFRTVNKSNFKNRLEGAGVTTERRNIGNVAYLEKVNSLY